MRKKDYLKNKKSHKKYEREIKEIAKKYWKQIIAILTIIIILITIITNKKEDKINRAVTANAEKLSYNEPYIPYGFQHTEGTWNTGYVIKENTTGNEFVWIPVDGTNIKLERKDFSVSDVSNNSCTDIQNPLFEESVAQNGGFYIARYESGIPEGSTISGENKNITGIPVSKKTQEVWNYINYENAETSANQMYSENSELTSSLMNGKAWDTVLTWLEQNGVNVSSDSREWGNYLNNEYSSKDVSKTGYENWVANNIYDIAGNVSEWTTEKLGNSIIRRGGNYSNEGQIAPAGMREKQSKTQFNNTTGFRVMLYKTGERTIEGYDTPYVPSGFEHTEGTWNTGYVIKDTSNGNEFVWVPVNGTDVKIKRNNFGTSFANKENATDRLDLQFKISVNTNGGFYIARYESGQGTSNTGETLQGNVSGRPVSKKGTEVWTNISQNQAIKNSSKMYASHPDMQSTLISGYAMDMTLQWLENSGVNVSENSSTWGNYSSENAKASKALTGSNEKYKANNIYDLAGNVWELTTEKYNNGQDIIARGGDYLSTGSTLPAGSRDIAKNSDEYNYMGYRTILYKTTKIKDADVPEEWDATKVNAIQDEDGNTIPIPKGFYYVKGSKDTGIVISDNSEDENKSDVEDKDLKGNQFVYVPVDTNTYFTRRDFGDTYVDINATETVNNKYWENIPDELKASVSRYKGFYIARYEASYKSGTTADDYMPSSKVSTLINSPNKEGNLWNNISFENAQKASENMYKDSGNVVSTLTYGAEWDTCMQWLIDSREKTSDEVIKNSTSWGNYYNSKVTGNDGTEIKAINKGVLLNTGVTEYTMANNIYDLAGNLFEYSMEYYSNGYNALRGNYYSSNSSAINRNYVNSLAVNAGFRPSLYISMDTEDINIEADVTTQRNTSFTGDNNGVEAGPITVTISYGDVTLANEDKYQYKIGIDGEWKTSKDNIQTLKITENCTIFARYYTGEVGYQTKSYNITNVDNDPPAEFEIDAMNATEIGLVVNAETADALSNIEYYDYYLNNVKYRATKDTYKNYYTITNVKPGTKYTIRVEAIDEAGNKIASTNTKEITTWTPTTNAWNEKKQANKPELAEGMIPIKYNGTKWVTTTEDDEDWYNYNESGSDYESKWANIMLSDGKYKSDTVEAGTEIEESDLGSMFVWIPRYAYKIENGYHSSTAGDISIEFLEGTSSHKTGVDIGSYPEYSYSEDASESKMNNYVVHPAFNYDETQLTGLWIAKFIASRTDATNSSSGSSEQIKVVGNKYVYSNINVGEMYTACIGMNDTGNSYGLTSNDETVDPHLMKNMEWGAMAYLTQSKYGLNKTEAKETSNNLAGYDYSKNVVCASTKNIYGIYDLESNYSYKIYEAVSAYVDNGNANLTSNGSELISAPKKHKDVYKVGTTGNILSNTISDTLKDNYEATKEKYGDSQYETSYGNNGNTRSWYYNYNNVPNTQYPFMVRGYYNYGIFGVNISGGAKYSTFTFRPTIAVIDENPSENIQITADVTTPRNTSFTGDNNGVEAGPITVTINYGETGLQKQYKEGISGSWKTVSESTKQIKVTSNETIYARYYDGTNGIKTKSYTIANVDNESPNSFKTYNNYVEGTGIEISGYTTDTKTEKVTYKYYLDNTLVGTNQTKSCTTNIDTSKDHTTYIQALDEAGNLTKSTIAKVSKGITGNSKWNKEKQANKPELAEGMIPIKYNGTKWVTTTEDDEDWYNYNESGSNYESKWANIMLSDGKYKSGTVEAGTEVEESDLGSMFVWIPRYAYKIENGYHSSTAGDISIEFLEGTSSHKTGVDIGSYPEYSYSEDASESKMNNYVVHPAFNYDETQLTGLWIAKFIASRTDATNSSSGSSEQIKVVGNKYVYSNINVGEMYTACIGMNDTGNSYGLTSNDETVDPHLMKNMEWGAMAYLTQSKYGLNKTEAKETSNNLAGYDYLKNVVCASTKNIYGIYDLESNYSYKIYEAVSAYVDNGNANLTSNGSELISAPKKHKDVYKVGTTGNILSNTISDTLKDNYEATKEKYGDSQYETSYGNNGNTRSWYYNYNNVPNTQYPFMVRGYYNYGIFGVNISGGAKYSTFTFRPTIAVIDENPSENIQITADVTTPRNTSFTGDNNGVEAGPITVTINYGETGLQKQYKEGISGSWKTVSESTKQIKVTSNETIYARYYDGTNGIKTKSYTIANVDNESPTFEAYYKNDEDFCIVSVNNVKDNNEIKKYYSINGGNYTEFTENSVTIMQTKINTCNVKAIDKAGNATIQEAIMQEGITAQMIANEPAKYYGLKVTNYTSQNGQNDWKIFYSDGEHIFLITGDYINTEETDRIDTSTGMTKSGYNAYWRSVPSFQTVNSEVLTRFKLTEYALENGHLGSECVSTLINENNWSSYKDSENKAEYAIGSPTVEMWMDSWNKRYPSDKIYCNNTNTYGYYVGTSSNPTSYNFSNSGKEGYKNKLYYPHTSSYNGSYGYWLASPSADYHGRVLNVDCGGYVEYEECDYRYLGVRPVVSLKAGASVITTDEE